MTLKEKAIATAYTGINFCKGDEYGEFRKYADELMGRPYQDIEMRSKSYWFKLRELSKPDFEKMLNGEYEETEMIHEWIQKLCEADVTLCFHPPEKKDSTLIKVTAIKGYDDDLKDDFMYQGYIDFNLHKNSEQAERGLEDMLKAFWYEYCDWDREQEERKATLE